MKDLYLYLKNLVWLLPLLLVLMSTDTIRPIPRIDKEFLIVAYIVYDKDTTIAINPLTLQFQISQVNAIFKPMEASFKICEVRYIYDFQFHDTISKDRIKELTTQYYAAKRINMYFIGGFKEEAVCGKGTLGGIGINNNDLVIVRKDCYSAGVIAHELGHYFNLHHTFEGGGSELVNGSNCSTEGDEVCDTPADPYVYPGSDPKDYVDDNCVFISERKDANGEYYDPNVNNIMSYYPCKCSSFSNQQFERMANYYLSNSFKW